ncbi:MAG TPA: class II glutamine amidotransferase [Thermoplasmata archaeon]|nr:class II glutamine amidotransferase [Thermoplasmata archaeon]
MCRLLGLIGSSPTPAEAWLVASDRSLLVQAHASDEMAQRDGWGIAWFAGPGAARVEKGTGGAAEPGERERFKEVAGRATGPVVVGHLRHASNPMNLPKARLIGPENSQPFSLGRTVFAHNGAIPLPRETRPRLGALEEKVQGVNDSEVLFLLLAHHLEETKDPVQAYARCVADLNAVWLEHGRPTPLPYTGLNVVLTRGPEELWAFCHWQGEHGTAFFDTGRPYYQMAYRANAQHALFGSEPFDGRPDWRTLSNGEYAYAQLVHGLVAVETGKIPLAGAEAARGAPVAGARGPRTSAR